MITENVSTLKIHKLSQEQYNRELDAGHIDENALYLTPEQQVSVPVRGVDYWTDNDIAEIKSYIDDIISSMATEEWTFVMDDDSTVTKKVAVME